MLPSALVRPMIGLGAKHMLEQGLRATGGAEDSLVEQLYPELLHYYEAHIAIHSRPFPGLIAALDRLDALGVRTAHPCRGLPGDNRCRRGRCIRRIDAGNGDQRFVRCSGASL